MNYKSLSLAILLLPFYYAQATTPELISEINRDGSDSDMRSGGFGAAQELEKKESKTVSLLESTDSAERTTGNIQTLESNSTHDNSMRLKIKIANHIKHKAEKKRNKEDKESQSQGSIELLKAEFRQCFAKLPTMARNQLGIPAGCTEEAKKLFLLGQRQHVLDIVQTYEDFDTVSVYKASPEKAQQEFKRCLKDNAHGEMILFKADNTEGTPLEIPKKCHAAFAHCAVLSKHRAMDTYLEFLKAKYPHVYFGPGHINIEYVSTNSNQNESNQEGKPTCCVNININHSVIEQRSSAL